MKFFAAIFLSAFALAVNAATNEISANGEVRAIMEKFSKRAATAQTVFMEFTQVRELKMFAEPLETKGVMLIAQPGKIRWETTAPYQTIMLGEKKSVAQFEFSDGKWQKLNLGFPQALQHAMDQMAAMNSGKLDAMLADFDITATNSDELVLTFVPKSETVRGIMSAMEIHLAPDLSATRAVVMREPDGDLTRITFSAEKYNVEFPVGTFDQNQPLPIANVKAAVNHAP